MNTSLARFRRLPIADDTDPDAHTWVLRAYCQQTGRQELHLLISRTARLERYQCRVCGEWVTVETGARQPNKKETE